MELPSPFWFWYYLGLVGCLIIIFLHFFGDRLERFYKRLESEEEGREDRNRAFTEEANRQGAERDRLRELANAEMERLWARKQRQ